MWLIERVGDSSKCEIKSTTNIYNKHLNIEIKNTTNHTNIQQLFVRCSGYINGVFIVFNWCRRWIFIAILLFWTGLMYVKEVYSSMYNVSAPKMMYRLMHRSRSLLPMTSCDDWSRRILTATVLAGPKKVWYLNV